MAVRRWGWEANLRRIFTNPVTSGMVGESLVVLVIAAPPGVTDFLIDYIVDVDVCFVGGDGFVVVEVAGGRGHEHRPE